MLAPPFPQEKEANKNRSKKFSYVRRRLRKPPHRSYSMHPAPCLLDFFNLEREKNIQGRIKKLCAHLLDIILLDKKKDYLTTPEKVGRGEKLYTKPEHLKVCPSERVVARKKNLWSLPSRRGGRGTQFPPLMFFVPPRPLHSKRNFKPRLLSSEYRVHTHTRTLPQPVATCGNFPPQCNSPSTDPPLKTKQKRRHTGERKKEPQRKTEKSLLRLKFGSPEQIVNDWCPCRTTLKSSASCG